MGPAALRFFHSLARKNLTKNQGSGIITIPNRMTSESEASAMIQTIVDSGLPLEKFDQFIRSEDDILKYLNIIKNANKQRVIAADSPEGRRITEQLFGKRGDVVDMTGKKIDTRKNIMGGKNIPETEDEIRRRLIKQNEEGIASMKSKLEDPEKKAMGGRIGYKSGTDFLEDELNKLRTQKGVEEDPLTSTSINSFSSIPDLNNPDVLNQIAIDTGMPMQKEGLYGFRKDVATPETTSIIKDIQNYKRNPDPDLRLTAPEISDFMGVDGIFKGLNPEQVQSIYDKVEKDNDEYDFSDIQGQTAFLDPFTVVGGLIKVGKGAKASALAKEFFKNKAKEKITKDIYDKIQKKINTPKYPTTTTKTGGGGSGGPPSITTTKTKSTSKSIGGTNPYSGGSGGIQSGMKSSSAPTNVGNPFGYADGGRAGFFMGSKPVKGLAALRQMLNYFGKKSDRVKNPSDILKIVNPKQFNKVLEDPNIYRKFDIEKGIAAPDLIKNMQKQMMGDRQKTIEEMLGAAKNIKSADDNIIKYKNEMIEDMLKKGVDREMAEEMAETISKMAKGSAGKFDDTPKLTDEGIMQLENILKDMETGGKKPRELNATGGRIGYKDGPKMNRRTFMKYLAGFASLPIIGKIVKPLKTVKGVKNVPIIKTGDVPGKPEWFDALINKVIIEGDDVTKKFATQERQVVYSKKIDADNEVTVYRDLDTDSVRVDYSSPDVMLDEPVSLSYTRGQADEATQGVKPADEFETFEQGLAARSNGPDDYTIDPEPNVGSSISSLETDVSKLKEYATGKKPTMKEFVASKKRKDRVRKINEGDIGEISDYATKRQGDYYDYDDYASGGIARMLGE